MCYDNNCEHVIWETENERLVMEYDEFAEMPDGEYHAPIMRVDFGAYRYRASLINSDALGGVELVNKLDYFLRRFDREIGISAFTRYITIFHDGKASVEYSPEYQSGDTIVCATTREIADAWGCEDVPDPDMSDMLAYLSGETYCAFLQSKHEETITRERTRTSDGVTETFTETVIVWENEDGCGGFYGDDPATNGAFCYWPEPANN